MAERSSDSIDRQFRAAIESAYSPIPRDDHEKIVDSVLTLIEMGYDRKQPLKSTLDFAVKTIFKHFDFHEIVVGLKDRKDGLYRYEVFFGYRKDLEDDMRKVKYTYDDMVSNDRFPFIKMGRLSELNPAEGMPEWERDWYKPHALAQKRKTQDEFHEGDYIDVWMYSYNKELVGWFEMASPMNEKLPARSQLRWIELIVAVCSSIVTKKWADEDAGQTRPTFTPVAGGTPRQR